MRKGYRFKGTGKAIMDGTLFEEIKRFYRSRWMDTGKNMEPNIRGFVLVKVETALPLISPAYDDGSSDELSIRTQLRHSKSGICLAAINQAPQIRKHLA